MNWYKIASFDASVHRVKALFREDMTGLIDIYRKPDSSMWVNKGDWSDVRNDDIRDAAAPTKVEIANEAGRPAKDKGYIKVASLIDNVQISSYTGGTLRLWIGTKKYEYSGIEGQYWASQINQWKQWKNKRAAGEKLSNLIRNIEPLRWKEPTPSQAKSTEIPNSANQQMDLF